MIYFRIRGASSYQNTPPEFNEDYMDVRGLEPNEVYEFKVVAVDGDFYSESEIQEVDTYGVGMYFISEPYRYFSKFYSIFLF